MVTYRYQLEEYKGPATRFLCPVCKDIGMTFVHYIDIETGKPINSLVGRCNRESKCGYHYPPREYFKDQNIEEENLFLHNYPIESPEPKTPTFIPNSLMKKSLSNYNQNNFVLFLIKLFGNQITSDLLEKYGIGTSNHWPGATVFWQIDLNGNIRTGKIMLYNPATGKRVKDSNSKIYWMHKSIGKSDFELQQCLFGEHLLFGNNKQAAIVESEKTAIIASIYFPQYVWLATGGLSNLTDEKCIHLKGRSVTLFPDLNGFEKWNLKRKELSRKIPGTCFKISKLLENSATEKEKEEGCDIADYLIKFDPKSF
ncbi:MAG: DUF6371 domain-containing protein [Mariniphaga sp.]